MKIYIIFLNHISQTKRYQNSNNKNETQKMWQNNIISSTEKKSRRKKTRRTWIIIILPVRPDPCFASRACKLRKFMQFVITRFNWFFSFWMRLNQKQIKFLSNQMHKMIVENKMKAGKGHPVDLCIITKKENELSWREIYWDFKR